jgi:hypothetical protein
MLRDYAALSILGRDEGAALERDFIARALAASPERREELTSRCRTEAEAFEARRLDSVLAAAPGRYPGLLYASAWRRFDRKAGMPRS